MALTTILHEVPENQYAGGFYKGTWLSGCYCKC